MSGLKDLMMDFLPYVPGMPDPHARRFLSIAADEFFTKSEIWRETWPMTEDEGADWLSTDAGVTFTDFQPDDPAAQNTWMRVVKVLELFYKDGSALAVRVPFVNIEKLSMTDPDYYNTEGGVPICWYNLSIDGAAPKIGIYPRVATTQTGVLFPRLVHSVKRQDLYETAALDEAAVATETQFRIPEFIYLQFGQTIVSGALAKALVVPGKDWTDPKTALYHRELFEDGIKQARSQADAGHTSHTERQMMYGGY